MIDVKAIRRGLGVAEARGIGGQVAKDMRALLARLDAVEKGIGEVVGIMRDAIGRMEPSGIDEWLTKWADTLAALMGE